MLISAVCFEGQVKVNAARHCLMGDENQETRSLELVPFVLGMVLAGQGFL